MAEQSGERRSERAYWRAVDLEARILLIVAVIVAVLVVVSLFTGGIRI